MAIIRNDRSKHVENETVEEVEPEEEIDYSWHPNEDEFVSPLTADQWAELLSDSAFATSDAGKAVTCLREYGEPATFQQLSIRYRGTMGRYRRWLAEAAHMAGDRFGVPAPQKDQFGMDEWWPLLYQVRNAGKPGAGIFEMMLRPEVEEGFLQIEEAERQAKRAENARQLQRIEKLERAKQEERRRVAATKEIASQHPSHEAEQKKPVEDEPAPEPAPAIPKATSSQASDLQKQKPRSSGVVSVPMSRFKSMDEDASKPVVDDVVATTPAFDELPATRAFLELMVDAPSRGMRFVASETNDVQGTADLGAPVDYALRYAERLRYAFALMRKVLPTITYAAAARALGDASVEHLQQIVNGQAIPEFAYLDRLQERIGINVQRLEASDGNEDGIPTFVSLHESLGARGVESFLLEEPPQEIAYVVDDSDERRTGVIVRFSEVRCALLTRRAVSGAARRSEAPQLEAFIRMVDELDGFARAHDVARTSRQVSADDWNRLVQGSVWPGALLK